MLALDAKLTIQGEETTVHSLGDFLLSQRNLKYSKLVISIEIPLQLNLAFETVSRTPGDKPIICAAVAQWKSGRTRLALGGWGKTPTLGFDGTDAFGIEEAARSCASEANDEWASAEYRSGTAPILAKRCLKSFS
jgi:CO/xanthine dehydrogenase FAD-binding subunit